MAIKLRMERVIQAHNMQWWKGVNQATTIDTQSNTTQSFLHIDVITIFLKILWFMTTVEVPLQPVDLLIVLEEG